MKEIIKIEHLHKTYDTGAVQVHALRDVNLTITEGEYVAIMGQSGSGKSTLMNILGCMDRRFEGTYLLDGISIEEQGENELSRIRNKKIGFVFQAFQLIPRTSALKNVEIPMIYAGMKGEKRRKKAEALLEKVGLGERIHHMPNELSGGQKQRVAIARALANDPAILLADEPTGNLDTKASHEIMEFFTKLNEEGATVIVVTHEEDIAQYTKRIVRFQDGQIISDTKVVKEG
ncbi:ATP-binding cassette domain-containing protein [Anaerotignum sp.]